MNSRLKLKQIAFATTASATMMLGLASNSQAITLGEPGEALLVPYVLCDATPVPGTTIPSMNTQIGVTTSNEIRPNAAIAGNVQTNLERDASGFAIDPAGARTVHNSPVTPFIKNFGPYNGITNSQKNPMVIKWAFFDAWSKKVIDGAIPATPNDFVGIDWCSMGGSTHVADGKVGYMVIFDSLAEGDTGATFAMWGTAYLINNTWASMALIPVLPMADGPGFVMDSQGNPISGPWIDPEGRSTGWPNEVTYNGGTFPANVVPWNAGIRMNNQDGDNGDKYIMALRYLLHPGFTSANEFVFWFDRNCSGAFNPIAGAFGCNRTAVDYEVYDSNEEFQFSGVIDIQHELNVYHFETNDPWGNEEGNDPWLSGMEQTDGDGLENAGLAFFKVPEGIGAGRPDIAGSPGVPGDYSAGVAFTLIFVDTADNPFQVQTELAQERGFQF
jgi:hypothetical protein